MAHKLPELKHNAVFFTGHRPKGYARAVWRLLAGNGAERIVFVDHIETLDMTMNHTDRFTFFIPGAPQEEGHLSLLERFDRKAIVYLNNSSRTSDISSVLRKVRGVHVIQMNGNQGTPAHRLHRILRGLGGIHPPPVHPSVVETVLRKSKKQPEIFTTALIEPTA